jgi:hypothetical protein
LVVVRHVRVTQRYGNFKDISHNAHRAFYPRAREAGRIHGTKDRRQGKQQRAVGRHHCQASNFDASQSGLVDQASCLHSPGDQAFCLQPAVIDCEVNLHPTPQRRGQCDRLAEAGSP